MKPKPLPEQKYLQECFNYDPETGLLYWKKRPVEHFKTLTAYKRWNTRYSNKEAFTATLNGYCVGRINDIGYPAHRVIYKLWYGIEPNVLDHDNRIKTDNRIKNLVDGTKTDNGKNTKLQENNTSGVTGVVWNKVAEKWQAQIMIDFKNKYLGRFSKIEDAIAARKAAEVLYRFHPNHGRDLQTVTF